MFTPVEPQSTYEETLNRLGTAIRLGVLSPGERLPPERELAERMRISRSTLRQALAVLTGSGHLVAVRGRSGGTFVAESPPLSVDERPQMLERFEELVGFRTAVEVGATSLGAEVGTAERLDELDRVLERQRQVAEGDAVAYLRADALFHLALARVAGNQRLERTMTELQGETQELMAVQIRSTGMPDGLVGESLRQHEAIAAAVREHAAEDAAGLVREHMRLFGVFMRLLAD